MPIPVEHELLQGTLDVLVLRALSRHRLHGYAIARFIRESSADAIRVLDGALYTALHRMEERGWIESDWGMSSKGKRAKYYRMTPAGRRALKTESEAWDRYVAAVAGVMRAVPEKA